MTPLLFAAALLAAPALTPVSTTSTIPPSGPSSTAAPSTTHPPASVSTVPPTSPTTTAEVLVAIPPVPRPTTGSTVPPPSLPVTGSDRWVTAWLAGCFTGAGIGLLIARRIAR